MSARVRIQDTCSVSEVPLAVLPGVTTEGEDMTKRSEQWRQMIEAGHLAEVIEMGSKTDSTADDLRLAGYLTDGRRVRPGCGCTWYDRAPVAHDRMLDLEELPLHSLFDTILNNLRLGDAELRGDDPGTLFKSADEIEFFFNAHGLSHALWGHNRKKFIDLAGELERVSA